MNIVLAVILWLVAPCFVSVAFGEFYLLGHSALFVAAFARCPMLCDVVMEMLAIIAAFTDWYFRPFLGLFGRLG